MVMASFNRAKTWTSLSSFNETEGALLATEADNEVRQRTGLYFYATGGAAQSVTEDKDGGLGVIRVKNTPVIAITSISNLNNNGTISSTISSSKYTFYSASGQIIMRDNDIFQEGSRNIRVVYTHGVTDTDLRYTMAILAATHILCRMMLEQTAKTEAVRIGGSVNYTAGEESENHGIDGPYSAQIKYAEQSALAIIRRITGGYKEST